MQYIIMDGDTITSMADWEFPGSFISEKAVVRGWDGQLYFEGDGRIERPQSVVIEEQIAEIKSALVTVDADSIRALRAVLLDMANGVSPSGDDLARLALDEAEVLALRDALPQPQGVDGLEGAA